MAYYAVITDLTRPVPHTIVAHFDMMDDATDPDTLVSSGSHGFAVTIYDETTGDPITETFTQKRNRLRTEFDAYIDRLIRDMAGADTHFETLRTQVLAEGGYRYPPAS